MRERSRGRAAIVAAVLMAALATTGCTGEEAPEKKAKDQPTPTATPAPPVPLRVAVGKVTGTLPKPARPRVAQAVASSVDAWFEAAYLGGEYPRTDFADAFSRFTRGAGQRAARDRKLMTNAALGAQTEGVTAVRKSVTVDVLSPRKRPAGATARFRLVYRTTGRTPHTVQVSGRLMLTPTATGSWLVFGYDVARNAAPRKGAAR